MTLIFTLVYEKSLNCESNHIWYGKWSSEPNLGNLKQDEIDKARIISIEIQGSIEWELNMNQSLRRYLKTF